MEDLVFRGPIGVSGTAVVLVIEKWMRKKNEWMLVPSKFSSPSGGDKHRL